MTERDLLHAMRKADKKYIQEADRRAAEAAVPKKHPVRAIILTAAGAAACLGAVLFVMHGKSGSEGLTTANNDASAQIEEATVPADTETDAETTTTGITEYVTGSESEIQTILFTTTEDTESGQIPYEATVTGTTVSAGYTPYQSTAPTSTSVLISTTITRITEDDFVREQVAYVHVTYVNGDYMLVKPDPQQWLSQYESLELSAKFLPTGTTPKVGAWLEVYYEGSIAECSPPQFSHVIEVVMLENGDDPVIDPPEGSITIGQNEVYVWHDLIQEQMTPGQAIGDDGEYRLKLAAFPDTEFIWRRYGIYYKKNGTETMILGSGTMQHSNTITPWQVYFTDMTGDGYPDLCINYCRGVDFFCTQHVVVFDYKHIAYYNLMDASGEYDYVFRYRNNKMYVEEIAYSEHPALKFKTMTGTLGTIEIEDPTCGVMDFYPTS